MQRCIVTSCERAFVFTLLRRLILTWHFSWHREEMKEDALQEGLLVPDEATIRGRVLQKHVGRPRACYRERLPSLSCGHEQEEDQGEK